MEILSRLTVSDYIVLTSFTLSLLFFMSPFLEKNRLWTATVTPLASIIGSGYLVSAPLLYFILGKFAVLGMLGIVFLAYLIGSAIRYNILKAEPIIYEGGSSRFKTFLLDLERFSNLSLAFAYMISIAFYLRLLSAFVFSGFFERNELYERTLTTALLLFIGISGFIRGLHFLEFMEKYAVSLKLSIIFSFLIALLYYNSKNFSFTGEVKPFSLHTLEVLGGILLIVQGFETSKYLGEEYTPWERVKSMKIAQWISGFIYVSFTFLITSVFVHNPPRKLDETEIIFLASVVSFVLGYLLRIGPLMSQFSAAVADTIGAGGLIYEETNRRISSKFGYLITTLVGVVLVWSANVFEIIAYASKAFAFYYLLQTFIAWIVSLEKRDFPQFLIFTLLIPVLTFIVLLGKSAE